MDNEILDFDYEDVVMNIIMYSGNCKSRALQAINCAKKGDYQTANDLIKEANTNLLEAHKTQTYLITQEINGKNIPIKLLMVHAQDHLMNVILAKDLAIEFIELYQKIKK